MHRQQRIRYTIDAPHSMTYNPHNIHTMAALCLAKGLARMYIPTTSPDFPLSLLLKALLSSNGTAPWKRHSLKATPVTSFSDVAAAYRPTISRILIHFPLTPYILPTTDYLSPSLGGKYLLTSNSEGHASADLNKSIAFLKSDDATLTCTWNNE